MELPHTPILGHTTPPHSPTPARSLNRARSPQSVMGSPAYSPAYSMRSPQLQSPNTRYSHARSPQLESPSSRHRSQASSRPRTAEEDEDSSPRLVIRKLVMVNYKSYAGRQEVGPFNENFTAVVGPNGSGKSNVIDSLLFVFGFRAKKMRQDKLTGLIHKSEEHPDLTFARVEVHFETTQTPDSGLVLSREVREDGSNFYALDGKRSSYAEVTELLERRGIDLKHKRFLILQGEVESIALMPPKAEVEGGDGLLEYLEDIIGTSDYKTRIGELEAETELLRQDCGEKQRRVEIVERDLKKLDSERAEIEKFMIHQNRAIVSRSRLYQLQVHKLRNTLRISEEDIAERSKQLTDEGAHILELRNRIKELQEGNLAKTEDIAKLKAELKEASAELKKAQLNQVKVKQRKDQLESRMRKAQRNIEFARSQRAENMQWIANMEGDSAQLHERLRSAIDSEKKEQGILEEIQAELHESTRELHDELEALQAKAEPWREQITAKRQEAAAVEAERDGRIREQDDVQRRYDECNAVRTQISTQGQEATKLVKRLAKSHDALKTELEEKKAEIPKLEERKASTLSEIERLSPELHTAKESREASQSRNRIEAELMRLKIPGLYGRLGSLGSIDEKYDVAVSTAAPELNNFVVDNVETAKRCIEELRHRSIGRAKFMVLSKLDPVTKSKPEDFPAPRLIDLVRPIDPQFVKAFHAAMGDTLVVSDAQEATRVAFGGPRRNRVVTLGGMIMKNSGEMSGGGRPLQGLMARVASSLSTEELEGMERKLASLQLDYTESRSRLNEFRSRVEELQRMIPETAIELEKEQMSLKELESQMTSAREKRHAIMGELQALKDAEPQQLKDFQVRIANIEQDRLDLERQSHPIEQEIRAMQERILNAGGLRLREQNSKVKDLQMEANELRRRIEDSQAELAQRTSKVKKSEQDIEKFEKEIEEGGQIVETEVNEKDTLALEGRVQHASSHIDSKSNEIEAAKSEIAGLSGEVDELRASEIEIKNTLEGLQKSQQSRSQQLGITLEKLSSLQLYDVTQARSLDAKDSDSASGKDDLRDGTGDVDRDNNALNEDDEDVNEGDVMADDEYMQRPSSAIPEYLPELSPDELEDLNEDELKRRVSKSEQACEGISVNIESLERYKARYIEYTDRKQVSDESLSKYERVKDEAQRLKKRRYTDFMDGFLQISAKLKEMYQLITMGGNAELELVDTMDPFSEGILFSVMPPKKSWRNIANLSGGEKTLSSLALVFALHHFKPTPLYVMDEIDAALDFRNVSIIANYIKERTKNGQFIVISLRNNMFELASRLVGVYKVQNMSRSVTLQID